MGEYMDTLVGPPNDLPALKLMDDLLETPVSTLDVSFFGKLLKIYTFGEINTALTESIKALGGSFPGHYMSVQMQDYQKSFMLSDSYIELCKLFPPSNDLPVWIRTIRLTILSALPDNYYAYLPP